MGNITSITNTSIRNNNETFGFNLGYLFVTEPSVTIETQASKQKVIFDGDYTIYYDFYGKKTVVKRMEGEPYDKEKAVMYALLKSQGIAPKDIKILIDNGVDNKAKREEKLAKKEAKKQEKQNGSKD